MTKSQDISTGRHCVFAMHVHLVFVTIDTEYLTETPSTDFVYCSPAFARTLRLNLSRWTEETTTSTCWSSIRRRSLYPIWSAQGCIQPNVETRTTRLGRSLLERRALVAVLLRCQLRWRTYHHSQGLHSTTKSPALTGLYPRPKGRGFTPERVRSPTKKKRG